MEIRLELSFKEILTDCFQADCDLLKRWHIFSGRGLKACVDKTFKDLKTARVMMFSLRKSGRLCGYFCRENCDGHQFLTGFFLKPEYRTPEGRAEFWNVIQQEFRKPFYCGLYDKNQPAKRFIESRGAMLVKKVEVQDGLAALYKIGA